MYSGFSLKGIKTNKLLYSVKFSFVNSISLSSSNVLAENSKK